MDLGTSFKRRMCGRLRDTPVLIYGVAGAFSVQYFSISPMHGMAFLDSSLQRVRDRIVRALHMIFSSSVCSMCTIALASARSNRVSRTERFTLAGYCYI